MLRYKSYNLIFAFLVLFSLDSDLISQSFDVRQTVDFLSIQNPKAYVVDLNNDGKLDVFVSGEDINGEIQYLVLARADGPDSLQNDVFNVVPLDQITVSGSAFAFSDLNNDNQMDLIISGRDQSGSIKNQIYHGDQGFEFQLPVDLPEFEARKIVATDLDNDGKKEIIRQGVNDTGNPAIEILTESDNGQYTIVNASLPELIQGDVVLFDFDKNNYVDLFYQGYDVSGIPASALMMNYGDFNFTEVMSGVMGLANGSIKVADYDADGYGDLLVHGIDDQAGPRSFVYLNKKTSFEQTNIDLAGIGVGQSQFADLNHDGRADISLKGIAPDGSLMNLVYLQDNTGGFQLFDDLIPNGVQLSQLFGDFYFDGNLDVIQWKLDAGRWVFEFLENTGLTENLGPEVPTESYAIQTFDDVKIFWFGASDDRTPAASLTYDIFIGESPSTVDNVSPSFDLTWLKRMLVSHGNLGFNTEMNIFDLVPDVYYYGIQPVDNSFHAVNAGDSTIIHSFVVCEPLSIEYITACDGETITLPSDGEPRVWFSVKQGFLGEHLDLTYSVSGPDTLFFNTPGRTLCDYQGAVIIDIFTPDVISNLPDLQTCELEPIAPEYVGLHDSVRWTVKNSGLTSTDNPWEFTPDTSIQVCVEIYVCGMAFFDTIQIDVLPGPEVIAMPDSIEIFSGDSVHLMAIGADSYIWSPEQSLNQNDIPNPIAKPNETTIYSVAGLNSEGCEDDATVKVIVHDVDQLSNFEPCPDEEVSLHFPFDYDMIEWTVAASGMTFTDNPLVLTPDQETEVYLKVNIGSLTWHDTLKISPVPFVLEVADDSLEIFIGESVELRASGADSYIWSPAETLDQDDVANPLATPDETTIYVVTGISDEGCEKKDTIVVIVHNKIDLFIPTLFTPNSDNRNDQFKIYGSALPETLDFEIFNRSGQRIARKNLHGMVNEGWDGRHKGVPQPPGVYFWRATGFNEDGSEFTYKDRKNGSVHLIR